MRPFGRCKVTPKHDAPFEVDFDEIHKLLISPALEKAGIAGNTTAIIIAAGNIRRDMFQLLAQADIVVAEVSLHNANVFYELGIRHALRSGHTFMIRFNSGEDVPFDIKTDRYLTYDKLNPAASVEDLAAGLRATLTDVDIGRVDSPVYSLLPDLIPPNMKVLAPVPLEFIYELRKAVSRRHVGHIVLLGEDAAELPWAIEGMRLVAKALRSLNANAAAKNTWVAIKKLAGDDIECAIELARLLQRMGDHVASESEAQTVLDSSKIHDNERAIALHLLGVSARSKWMKLWAPDADTLEECAAQALHSPSLEEACNRFQDAFTADLHNFDSGVEALIMIKVRTRLAAHAPDAWADKISAEEFSENNEDDDREGPSKALKELETRFNDLAAALKISIGRAIQRTQEGSLDRRWALVSSANLSLLRGDRAGRIVATYSRALESAPAEVLETVVNRWENLEVLGLFTETLKKVRSDLQRIFRSENSARETSLITQMPEIPDEGSHLVDTSDRTITLLPPKSIPPPTRNIAPPRLPNTTVIPDKIILFTGGTYRNSDGSDSLFTPAVQDQIKKAIRSKLTELVTNLDAGDEKRKVQLRCIAGGSSGGDILFHEVCIEMGLPAMLYLSMADTAHIVLRVQTLRSTDWIERFNAIKNYYDSRDQICYLGDSELLPIWLNSSDNRNFLKRACRWIVNSALEFGAARMLLIAMSRESDQESTLAGNNYFEETLKYIIELSKSAGAKIVHIPMPTPAEPHINPKPIP